MEKILRTHINNQKETVLKISKALSNQARLDILDLISSESLSIDEIARKLNMPITSVSGNIAILENAGLVMTRLQGGKHGTLKLCSTVYESININVVDLKSTTEKDEEIVNIPIGNYFNFNVSPTCGLVGVNGFIGKDDDPATFASNERHNAQLIWFQKGFIEYLVPYNTLKTIKELNFTMEVCSEAPNYRNIWPSDITILLNDVEIGTWKCPGDFGGRKGNVTPKWWSINSTQFGLLKTWTVNEKGSFIDFSYLSSVNLKKVFAKKNNGLISIKIMIKDDAQNIGGINIFGEKFGDYPQGMILKITYE